jgi:hypothetical protein
LRRFDDRGCAGLAEYVGNKGMLAGGNERLGPNDEDNPTRGNGGKLRLESGEPALEFVAEGLARI